MHDVLDGDGSFLGNALGEEITDFDVEAILGDIMAPANIMEDPSRTDLEVLTPATVGARSALHAAQKFLRALTLTSRASSPPSPT